MKYLVIALALFLGACQSTMEITTTAVDGTETKIKGKSKAIVQHLALEAQKEVAASDAQVQVAKYQSAQCNTISEEALAVLDAEGREDYFDYLGRCEVTKSMFLQSDELGENIQIAGGEGSASTRVAESYASVAKVEAQASAQKVSTWGKVITGGVITYGVSNAVTGLAAGLSSGGSRIMATNGSQVNYVSSDSRSLSDGVSANVLSDNSEVPGHAGPGATPGNVTINAEMGDYNGNVQDSHVLWDNNDFKFQSLAPYSQATNDESIMDIPNNSHDPVFNNQVNEIPEPIEPES